jgi:hypothetical protein
VRTVKLLRLALGVFVLSSLGCSLVYDGSELLDGRDLAIRRVSPEQVYEGQVDVTVVVEAEGLSVDARMRLEIAGADEAPESAENGAVAVLDTGMLAETFDIPVLPELGAGAETELVITVYQPGEDGELISKDISIPVVALDELDCFGCSLAELQPLYSTIHLYGEQQPGCEDVSAGEVFCEFDHGRPLVLEATRKVLVDSQILYGTRIRDSTFAGPGNPSPPCPGGGADEAGGCASGGAAGAAVTGNRAGSGGGGGNARPGSVGSGPDGGAGGAAQGSEWLVDPELAFGGGGGGGSSLGPDKDAGGRGGDGGGVVVVRAPYVELNQPIFVGGGHGEAVVDETTCDNPLADAAGNGGGGAGGGILVQAARVLSAQSGFARVDGGIGALSFVGGDLVGVCSTGGSGAGGVVRVDAPNTLPDTAYAQRATDGPNSVCVNGSCGDREPSLRRGPALLNFQPVVRQIPVVVQVVGEIGQRFRIEVDGEVRGFVTPELISAQFLVTDLEPGVHELCLIIDGFDSSLPGARLCRPLVYLPRR